MVKQTQTICRLLPTNCLSVFEHLVRLALEGLILFIKTLNCFLLLLLNNQAKFTGFFDNYDVSIS